MVRTLSCAVAAGALSLAAACRLEHRQPPPDTTVAELVADSTIDAADLYTGEELTSFRRDKHYDFTGEGHAEEIKVRARGDRSDALTVTLRIEAPNDSVLYFDSWPSAAYLKYTDQRARVERRVVRAAVQGSLERILADSNFGTPVAQRIAGRYTGLPSNRAETVQRDVAGAIWRQRHGMQSDAAIPPAARDSFEAFVRTQPDRARVRRILGEIGATNRFFMYSRGGEETIVLAWSPSEKRFVRVWECC